MKLWMKCGLGLACLAGLIGRANAQVPGVPAAAAPAAAVAPAPATAAGTATGTKNIWSFFCMTPEQKAECKAKICNSQIGKLGNNMLKPVGALTGGLIGPCCPDYTAADLAMPADTAGGAAAKIKADEAAAKKRRADVRYLGTVDCNWWPEAQAALINALRADRNECVRMEAAMSLGRGCCCNKATMEALRICVEGSREDGNPPERCERVLTAARWALEHCLSCYVEIEKVPPGGGTEDRPKGTKKMPAGPITPAAYYDFVRSEQSETTVAGNAQRALKKTEIMTANYQGGRSMLDILRGTSPTRGKVMHEVTGDSIPLGVALDTQPMPKEQAQPMPQKAAPVVPASMPMVQPAPMPVGAVMPPVEHSEPVVEAPAGYVRKVNNRGVRVYRKAQPMQQPVSSYVMQPQQMPVIPPVTTYAPAAETESRPLISSYAPVGSDVRMPVTKPMPEVIAVETKSTYQQVPQAPVVAESTPAVPAPMSQPQVEKVVEEQPAVQEEQSVPAQPAVETPSPEPKTEATEVKTQPTEAKTEATNAKTNSSDIDQVLHTVRYSTVAEQRVEAVYQLARMKDASAEDRIHGLVDATEDLSPAVRHAAVVSLYHVNIRSQAVLDALKRLQDDADQNVRARAEAVLKAMFEAK